MIERLKPSQLRMNPNNPRTIKTAKFRLLVESLEQDPEMLEARPIVVDPSMMVLGGNMRLKAARAAKLETVPVYIANWDEVKQRRFILKDNASYGDWDWDMLLNEWEPDEIQSCGVDIPDYEPDKEEAEEDNYEVPEVIHTNIEPGARFQIGEHRLIVADSTRKETFETLLPEQWADCVVTDPPYNVDYTGSDGKKIANDKMGDAAFRSFLTDAFRAMNEKVKLGGGWYIWHADSEGFNFRAAMKDAGILQKQTLVWVKNSLVLGRQDYQWQHEPCLYGWKAGAAHYFTEDRSLATTIQEDPPDTSKMKKDELRKLLDEVLALPSSVIHHDKPSANKEHPTMKPIGLMGQLIANSTRKDEIVLDGFLGSGSTMVAAHQLGRRCYGVEMDPQYAQVTIDRMLQLDPTLKVEKQ